MMQAFVPRLLIALVALAPCLVGAAAAFHGVVTPITDGDTLWVRPAGGGAPRQVRLLGIDAPEICQPFGPQARDALASLLANRRVTVHPRARDTYERTLAKVRLGREDAGAWMVKRGHAWSSRYRGRGRASRRRTA